jgi:hypothetical protein
MELLLRGADVAQKSGTCGSTPLHFAATNDHIGIVEILLRSGADPSVPSNSGRIAVELCGADSVKRVLLGRRGEGRGWRCVDMLCYDLMCCVMICYDML